MLVWSVKSTTGRMNAWRGSLDFLPERNDGASHFFHTHHDCFRYRRGGSVECVPDREVFGEEMRYSFVLWKEPCCFLPFG